VFVAGEKGIGFYAYDKIDVLASEPVLADISFQQVLTSEATDPAKPKEQSKIAIFALASDHSLYYVEGIRDFKTRAVTFHYSGFPIREGLSQMSSMYNANYGTSELLYTLSAVDKIMYMRRTPGGDMWIEDEITVKGKKSIKYDAFVTTITLSSNTTKAPAINFPVKVSSENLQIVANGITHVLSQKAINLYTDPNGCITVVIPAGKDLGCPALRVTVEGLANTSAAPSQFTCQVEPSGRIDRLLSSIFTADQLKNAKSSSNATPFQDMSSTTLESSADILRSYAEAKSLLASSGNSGSDGGPRIIMGDIGSEPPNLLTTITDTVVDFLGDAIECLKWVVKKVTKAVIYVVGPAVKILFKILGKWVSFTLKTLYNLLSAVGACLQDVFGFDGLNKLLEYCRLAVDKQSIVSTQKVSARSSSLYGHA
jgi:hypothetical protein